MKHFFLAVSAIWLITASHSFAQSDDMNKEKYWKFRTDFREKFIYTRTPLVQKSLHQAPLIILLNKPGLD